MTGDEACVVAVDTWCCCGWGGLFINYRRQLCVGDDDDTFLEPCWQMVFQIKFKFLGFLTES